MNRAAEICRRAFCWVLQYCALFQEEGVVHFNMERSECAESYGVVGAAEICTSVSCEIKEDAISTSRNPGLRGAILCVPSRFSLIVVVGIAFRPLFHNIGPTLHTLHVCERVRPDTLLPKFPTEIFYCSG